jgi:hypothetical protein
MKVSQRSSRIHTVLTVEPVQLGRTFPALTITCSGEDCWHFNFCNCVCYSPCWRVSFGLVVPVEDSFALLHVKIGCKSALK